MKKFFIYLLLFCLFFFSGYFIGKYRPEWLELEYWKSETNNKSIGLEEETDQDEIENVLKKINKTETEEPKKNSSKKKDEKKVAVQKKEQSNASEKTKTAEKKKDEKDKDIIKKTNTASSALIDQEKNKKASKQESDKTNINTDKTISKAQKTDTAAVLKNEDAIQKAIIGATKK
ncbi:MAG TPA: hypothetical protein PLM75_12725 [bacterium]|nr:hypothetical protein [bacterium]